MVKDMSGQASYAALCLILCLFPELLVDISKNSRVVCGGLQTGLLKPGSQLNSGNAWTLTIDQIADFIFAELIC